MKKPRKISVQIRVDAEEAFIVIVALTLLSPQLQAHRDLITKFEHAQRRIDNRKRKGVSKC